MAAAPAAGDKNKSSATPALPPPPPPRAWQPAADAPPRKRRCVGASVHAPSLPAVQAGLSVGAARGGAPPLTGDCLRDRRRRHVARPAASRPDGAGEGGGGGHGQHHSTTEEWCGLPPEADVAVENVRALLFRRRLSICTECAAKASHGLTFNWSRLLIFALATSRMLETFSNALSIRSYTWNKSQCYVHFAEGLACLTLLVADDVQRSFIPRSTYMRKRARF